MPLVSVVMPVYNTAPYLSASIHSILTQTFQDFEFIIINDGSTDGSGNILDDYQKKDKRIRVLNQGNRGLPVSLKMGCDEATGKYIARMDSDDISLPTRLAQQVNLMESHPEIGVCGTWIKCFGDIEEHIRYLPTESEEIRVSLLFMSVLAHPTVMMRRDLMIREHLSYRNRFEHAEDYDLWVRFSRCSKMANIPQALLFYRIHKGQIVQLHADQKDRSADLVRKEALKYLGLEPSEDEFELHLSICNGKFSVSRNYLIGADNWLCKLLAVNEISRVYDTEVFRKILYEKWCTVCSNDSELGLWVWNKFKLSILSHGQSAPIRFQVLFSLRCLLRKRRLRFWAI